MNPNTIGVLDREVGQRSQRDMDMLQKFSCNRIEKFSSPASNGIAVLGTNNEERTLKDKEMQREFSCSRNTRLMPTEVRENFDQEMMYPRSVKDMAMLKQFNCPCKN